MIHRSGQIGMREGDSAERTIAKRIAGSGLAIQSEEKTGLRINESVTKTVEHDPGDVALGIEAGGSKHVGHLLAYLPFVIGERGGKQFRSTQLTLRASRKARLGEIDEEGEHGRQIRAHRWRIDTKRRAFPHVDITAEALEPLGAGDAQVVEEAPVANGDVRRQDRKSTRLNSSHEWISYAVFCLKKK